MTYKAVAFDMDGTLLNNQRHILPETIAVIEKIKQKGIEIILVTGRHHTVVYPYFHQLQLETPTICCNGSYLYDFNKQHYSSERPLSKQQAKTLLDLVNQHKIHTLLYTDSYMTYEVLDDHLGGLFNWIASLPQQVQPKIIKVDSFLDVIEDSKAIFKFATSSHDIPALRAFSDAVEKTGQYECEWSWKNRADIALKGNSKGAGLENWAKSANIALDEIVAFGDSYNDISMLKSVGLGIAMGNADDEVKKHVTKVIGDNNHPSIAEELSRLFL